MADDRDPRTRKITDLLIERIIAAGVEGVDPAYLAAYLHGNRKLIHAMVAESGLAKLLKDAEKAPSVEQRVGSGKRAILADVEDGVVPSNVSSFSALHDYVDANEYVWPEKAMDADIPATNRVIAAIDAWIKAGGIPAPTFATMERWAQRWVRRVHAQELARGKVVKGDAPLPVGTERHDANGRRWTLVQATPRETWESDQGTRTHQRYFGVPPEALDARGFTGADRAMPDEPPQVRVAIAPGRGFVVTILADYWPERLRYNMEQSGTLDVERSNRDANRRVRVIVQSPTEHVRPGGPG